MEAEDGGGLQHHPLHHRSLNRAVCAIELLDDRFGRAADDADPDLALFQILRYLHRADGDKLSLPFVVMLDNRADFTAKQFVNSINTAGHGKK